LHIYGASDITVVGTVVSGRNLPINNIENSVGLFINTLPLVFTHNNKLSIVEQIKALQNSINEINSKNNVNLASLQAEGERLFDSLFVYENYPTTPMSTAAISYGSIQEIVKLDYSLAIIVCEKKQTITIKLKYAGELFDEETISSLLARLLFFIEQIIE
jgi:non-ribosomal peptide synthetase component F